MAEQQQSAPVAGTKGKNGNGDAAKADAGATTVAKAPVGLDDVNLSGFEREDQPSLDGWYKPEAGNGFYGKIVGSFQIEDKKTGKPRDIVIIALAVSVKAIVDKKEAQLEVGQFLGVSIRHKLQPLLQYVTHKGVVHVKAIDQVDIGGGQTMWNFQIRAKGEKSNPPAPRPPSADNAGKYDDIPF